MGDRPDMHFELGFPDHTYEYRTDRGTAFWVYRFDLPEGKETRPLCFDDEKGEWTWRLPKGPWPPYRVGDWSGRKAIVAEGEKAADAAAKLFPDRHVLTNVSGSNNVLKTDWHLLRDADELLILPDHDEPGAAYALQVAALAIVYEVQFIEILDSQAMGWESGDDIADFPDIDVSDLPLIAIDSIPARDLEGQICKAAATLSIGDYDRVRSALAKRLDIGKRTLDRLVKLARGELAEAEKEEQEAEAGANGPRNTAPFDGIVTGLEVFEGVREAIGAYVYLPDEALDAVSLACFPLKNNAVTLVTVTFHFGQEII